MMARIATEISAHSEPPMLANKIGLSIIADAEREDGVQRIAFKSCDDHWQHQNSVSLQHLSHLRDYEDGSASPTEQLAQVSSNHKQEAEHDVGFMIRECPWYARRSSKPNL
jgi:hypothetical protein